MDPVTFVPLALVVMFALAFPEGLRRHRLVRYGVVACLAVLFVNYITWRLPVTVLPADQFDIQGVLVWSLFGIESLAWFDATVRIASVAWRRAAVIAFLTGFALAVAAQGTQSVGKYERTRSVLESHEYVYELGDTDLQIRRGEGDVDHWLGGYA